MGWTPIVIRTHYTINTTTYEVYIYSTMFAHHDLVLSTVAGTPLYSAGMWQPVLFLILPLLVIFICAERLHRQYSGQPALLDLHYKGTSAVLCSPVLLIIESHKTSGLVKSLGFKHTRGANEIISV